MSQQADSRSSFAVRNDDASTAYAGTFALLSGQDCPAAQDCTALLLLFNGTGVVVVYWNIISRNIATSRDFQIAVFTVGAVLPLLTRVCVCV